MDTGISFGLFLLSIAGISLSGVMLPGPLTAVTIAKGYGNRNAGALIAIGHGIVEIPLMALVYLGFAHYFASPAASRILGIAGGLMLVLMGVLLLKAMTRSVEQRPDLPYSAVTAGIIMTGANPYFYLWWATIGAALLFKATAFGVVGMIVFGVVHWACDLVWEQFISFSVFKTKHLWTAGVQRAVFGVCALVLLGFGVWFGISAVNGA